MIISNDTQSATIDAKAPSVRARLSLPEYGWLLLPVYCAFLVFPLARILLAGIAFVWVAQLLFQRRRKVSYFPALFVGNLAMLLWLALCALLTVLANGLFGWAGKAFADGGAAIATILMFTFAVFSFVAAIVTRLLRIGNWGEAAILFACLMCMATGAVLSTVVDSLWTFPVSTLMASGLLAHSLTRASRKAAGSAIAST